MNKGILITKFIIDKIKFECANNHVFELNKDNFINQWCPECPDYIK